MFMDAQDRITFTRSTFRYGNSTAIVIPAQYNVTPKTTLEVVIKLADTQAHK